jgi:RNA polymerase sigma-70 factor (ECF subfamily)
MRVDTVASTAGQENFFELSFLEGTRILCINMKVCAPQSSHPSGAKAAFQHTLWSQVFAAGKSDPARAALALEALCDLYWYPLYAFLSRSGRDRHEASDLTQAFFHYLVKGDLLQKADPARGRFRSYLLGTLKNFVSHEAEKGRAQRRGGGTQIVSIDEETAEGKYAHEPVSDLSPDKLYDRRWAMTVVEEAMRRLQEEYARARMAEQFLTLQPYLLGEEDESFAELGLRLGREEGAARTLVCRLRKEYGKRIRAVIGDTVRDPEQVEIEYKHLLEALRGG